MRNLNIHLPVAIMGAGLLAITTCVRAERRILPITPLTNTPIERVLSTPTPVVVHNPREVSMRNYFTNLIDPDSNEWVSSIKVLEKPKVTPEPLSANRLSQLIRFGPDPKIKTDYDPNKEVAMFEIEGLLNNNFTYGVCSRRDLQADCSFLDPNRYDVVNGSIGSARKSRSYAVVGIDVSQTPDLLKTSGQKLSLVTITSNGAYKSDNLN